MNVKRLIFKPYRRKDKTVGLKVVGGFEESNAFLKAHYVGMFTPFMGKANAEEFFSFDSGIPISRLKGPKMQKVLKEFYAWAFSLKKQIAAFIRLHPQLPTRPIDGVSKSDFDKLLKLKKNDPQAFNNLNVAAGHFEVGKWNDKKAAYGTNHVGAEDPLLGIFSDKSYDLDSLLARLEVVNKYPDARNSFLAEYNGVSMAYQELYPVLWSFGEDAMKKRSGKEKKVSTVKTPKKVDPVKNFKDLPGQFQVKKKVDKNAKARERYLANKKK